MANPLKILTVLTASQAAKFQQGLDVNSQKVTGLADGTASTDAVAYGQLTTVSGALKSYVDAADTVLSGAIVAEQTRALAAEGVLSGAIAAETSRALAAEGVLSGAIAAETSRALAAEGVLSGAIAAEASRALAAEGVLSGAIAAETARALAAEGVLSGAIVAEASARAAADLTFLKLDGSRAMTAALNMGGFDITSAKSGSFSGDVTVGGNLQVNGALTYVNTTNLDVTDKLVTLAKGAANAAAADGGGIELEGAGATFTYDNNMVAWATNKPLNIVAEGSDHLYLSGNTAFGVLASPNEGEVILEVGSGFQTASLASSVVAVPNTLQIGGASFSYIATPIVNSRYDVDAAIHALDVAVSGAANAGNTFKVSYNNHRVVYTGALSSGQSIVNLQTQGGALFAAAELANIALDVMVDADNTGFTNDLVAIKMYVDGADVKVQIDAPATPSAAFRLIAVNEKDIA